MMGLVDMAPKSMGPTETSLVCYFHEKLSAEIGIIGVYNFARPYNFQDTWHMRHDYSRESFF